MRKSGFLLSIICAVLLLTVVMNYSVSYSSTPDPLSPSDLDNIQLSSNLNQSNGSAVEKLALALQQDKDNGDENGGENWDDAIDDLSEEMGIPVDDEIEGALLEITEIHLDNMSND
ncbi:hypothetical protein [Candidatus Nitrosocosmicus franklandus]|uniref:Uncharacterized protein n=1 Tax=Candidatus Nitrosocosmicus franklandianus TaxID=1798806 RepID=A0A484I7J3_9ARCH|nr:hypothetical protein [Candidatus Nitrosocosmicus franklandus]VFJ13141.1 conserved exported protein of unknown function [Candidatus Nitrosocosmicus franklandus]